MSSPRQRLLDALQAPSAGPLARPSAAADATTRQLVEQLEREQPADLERDGPLLAGVWELRWSSSRQPWLREAPWLENLQVLDPNRGLGMNLLRLKGPLGSIAAISVVAALEVCPPQRVSVQFQRGGWIGPRWGGNRLELLAAVRGKTSKPLIVKLTPNTANVALVAAAAEASGAGQRAPLLMTEKPRLTGATEPTGSCWAFGGYSLNEVGKT